MSLVNMCIIKQSVICNKRNKYIEKKDEYLFLI